MQINIATGEAIIHAVQKNGMQNITVSSRREKLERHIRVLKNHLEKYDVDEQTKRALEEDLTETEEELRQLIK